MLPTELMQMDGITETRRDSKGIKIIKRSKR